MNKPTTDSKPVKDKKNINVNALGEKIAHWVIVTVCEATMAALAVQGMLSVIHTEKHLQVALSVGFVAALLIIRFRSK